MSKKQPPAEVLDAIRRGDEKTHRAMSTACGKKAGQLSKLRADERALMEAEEKHREELQKNEFWEKDEQANLHTHPID